MKERNTENEERAQLQCILESTSKGTLRKRKKCTEMQNKSNICNS